MKTILQYYDKPRNIAISGNSGANFTVYDPQRVKNCEFDIVTSQAPNTSTYKALIEDKLWDLTANGLINLEMYLTHSTMPFAQTLLDDVRKQQEVVNQGGQPQITPEMMNKVGADPKVMSLLKQATGKAA